MEDEKNKKEHLRQILDSASQHNTCITSRNQEKRMLLHRQTRQTKLTFKLDFPGNLSLAAFAILTMFFRHHIIHPINKQKCFSLSGVDSFLQNITWLRIGIYCIVRNNVWLRGHSGDFGNSWDLKKLKSI